MIGGYIIHRINDFSYAGNDLPDGEGLAGNVSYARNDEDDRVEISSAQGRSGVPHWGSITKRRVGSVMQIRGGFTRW